MIVVDASALVALLAKLTGEASMRDRLRRSEMLAAPHLIDAEVAQALRRLLLRGEISTTRALGALADLAALDLERYPHLPLLERAFALRHNATVYDALYVALAEDLNVPLLTRDRALALLPDLAVRIEIIQ